MASKDEKAMDALAACVALHGSIAKAAKQLGMSKLRADALWMQICFGLGDQATCEDAKKSGHRFSGSASDPQRILN